MALDLQEQERVAALKNFWDTWGNLITWIILVIALGFAGHYGWRWYQAHEVKQAAPYFELIEQRSQAPSEQSTQVIDQSIAALQKDYASTLYTGRAILVASDYYIGQQQNDKAEKLLNWGIEKASDFPALQPIFKLRLAVLYAQAKQFDKAKALLQNPPAQFVEVYAFYLGQISYAAGDLQKAKEQFQSVVNSDKADAALKEAAQQYLQWLLPQ